MRTAKIDNTALTFSECGVTTTLAGGVEVNAWPHRTAEYYATAYQLGYGDNVYRMCLEHETAHSLLAHWLGLPESPTMRQVANGGEATPMSNLEEDAVLAIQRFARFMDVDLVQRLALISAGFQPSALDDCWKDKPASVAPHARASQGEGGACWNEDVNEG